MRNLSMDKGMLEGISNMDLIKNLMEHWQEDNEIVEILEKDNEEIRKETEAMEKEESEIWNNIMND
jgi:anaerobic ribonucleoside-triphosphate reductase